MTSNKKTKALHISFEAGHLNMPSGARYGLPAGVRIESLEKVFENPGLFESYTNKLQLNKTDMRGIFIFIPDNTILEYPLHLTVEEAKGTVVVVTRKNSELTFIEQYENGADNNGPHETIIFAGDQSRVDHYQIQNEGPQSKHASHLLVHQNRASSFSTHAIALGGVSSQMTLHALLEAESADCTVNGLYIGQDEQNLSVDVLIDHLKPNGTGKTLFKGIADDRSHCRFTGKVVVHAGAAKTNARQTNNNLLLSGNARVTPEPQLEIHNNDVTCSHGATVGQLDEVALFYLQTRGISKTEAQSMLTQAFAQELVDGMRCEYARTMTKDLLKRKLEKVGKRMVA